MYVLVLLLCEFVLIIFAFYLILSWLTKTPFYPSSSRKLDKLIAESNIKIPQNAKFIDIGSGDGRFVIWGAKKGMESHGIEFNPFLSLLSKARILVSGVHGKVKVFNKNFNNHDYSDYDIAYLYIFGEYMDKIKNKLFSEMKPGSAIITNTFTFSDIEPDEVHDRFKIYYIK